MSTPEEPTTKSPEEARAGESRGIVWKILIVSVILAVIAMIVIGQGTETPTG